MDKKKGGVSMGTKERILELLNRDRGAYLSGEELAERLRVSRTAVWKAVRTLQADGYEIRAVRNKGYSLAETTDIFSAEGVRSRLEPDCEFMTLQVLPSVPSTNGVLRELAANGAGEGTAVIANTQTAGRGRLGRHFYAPPDTGLYLSLLLRPRGYSSGEAVRVTTMAAVAACRAIEAVSGQRARIKWVNDICMAGRKVGGILTEGSFDMETGTLTHMILGIGINVYAPREGFPEELRDIAGSVFPAQHRDAKNRIAAAFLNAFWRLYTAKDPLAYGEEYRSRSMVIGKPVTVISGERRRYGEALDVDRDCRLIVRFGDGTVEALSSGEVSIRPGDGE